VRFADSIAGRSRLGRGDAARPDALDSRHTSLRLAPQLVVEDSPEAERPSQAPYHTESRWEHRYTLAVLLVDLLAIALASVITLEVRFQGDTGRLGDPWHWRLSAILAVAYVGTLAFSRAYEARFLGVGSDEFKRVFNAGVRFTALIATISYAANSTLGRHYVVLVLPVTIALDLAGRYTARKVLVRLRKAGRCLDRVVAAGSSDGVADLVRSMNRAPYAGLRVIGCCVPQPNGVRLASVESVPVLGDLSAVPDVIRETRATTVAVTSRGVFTPAALRRLSWQLEGSGVNMLVAPALTDITGPRIHIRPVAGLPLLHVEEPQLSGGRRLLKAAFDRVSALAALLVLAPALALIAVLVKVTSPGPVLYRQTRCGRDGRPFSIYKFRSMHVNADRMLAALSGRNEGQGVLFKVRDDPRVTPLGRYLCRHSLDELPQLVNVLRGEMSLVGPRPPLPSEVQQYATDVRRRLLVKPGLTGLWQVSGRSDLSWEESVRLDLEYVENWSLALDFMILWKTVGAVLRADGAY
jgi:exopolysaccharide biosynthesis polyprenyl glycosylphosphotransferase